MRELQTNNVTQENMLIFDTHQIVKNFINAGFTEQQAEAVTNEQKRIIESNLANKKDIAEVTKEIVEVKREIKELDAKLTREIAQLGIDFKKDIQIQQNKIIFRLGSVMVYWNWGVSYFDKVFLKKAQ